MNHHPDFERSQALVVCHSDGYVEVFGPPSLAVNIVRMPAAEQEKNIPKAEGILEESLAPWWRQWFFPAYLRKAIMNRPLKPIDVVAAQAMRVLKEYQ